MSQFFWYLLDWMTINNLNYAARIIGAVFFILGLLIIVIKSVSFLGPTPLKYYDFWSQNSILIAFASIIIGVFTVAMGYPGFFISLLFVILGYASIK